jgi:hypothetical protein
MTRLLLALSLAFALTACDPGKAPGAKTTPGDGSGNTASAGEAPAAGDLVGDYDYDAVISIDDPDGKPGVVTYTIRNQNQLKTLLASVPGDDPLKKQVVDFKTQSLVAVAQPGPTTPVLREVSVKGEEATVTYVKSEGSGRKGRYVARVVDLLPAKVSFSAAK